MGTRHPIKYLLQMVKLHCSSLPNGANKTATTVSFGGSVSIYFFLKQQGNSFFFFNYWLFKLTVETVHE